jgi:hypothetical protein
MINPTGGNIRNDKGGFGHFGASRKKTVDGRVVRYRHRGVDYVCIPDQEVWIPFTAVLIRHKNPYEGYHGVLFRGKGIVGTLFYVDVSEELIGKEMREGEIIGRAEDISQKYDLVTPHIHFQIDKIDPEILIHIYQALRGRS